MDNATVKTRLMPAAGHKGPRTVYRAYWRAEPGAAWQAVCNPAGLPIAYMTGEAAITAAEGERDACQAAGPFLNPFGGRELYLGQTPAFMLHRVDSGGALSPTEADELGRLITAALNASPAALAWARKYREAARHG